MRSVVRLAMLLLAALALAACPAPPDDPGTSGDVPAAPRDDAPTPPAPGGNPPAPGGTGTPRAPGGAATTSASPSGTTDPVVYENLRGGVWVARCPACGEVQAEGATVCPGCKQALSPWRMEVLCTRCGGDGRCDHCGDDRVCLVCDGAGACGICGGSGKFGERGIVCPDCAGSGHCTACGGDGRRDSAAGDLLPNEGWLPGACPVCIDASGLCPDCGSSGKDRAGGPCVTCGGRGVCPECDGDGMCRWCAGDGACTVCAGSGHEVRNGVPRGPAERTRTIRTSAGSVLIGRVDAPPTPQGLKVTRAEGGKPVVTTLPRTQVSPLSWFLVARDFAPGWDGRTAVEASDLSKFRMDLAATAADSGLWPLAMQALRDAIAVDPVCGPTARLRLEEAGSRRVEDWVKRADAAQKANDRDRAVVLFEMVGVQAGRGTGLDTRAKLALLQIRKDRELDAAKLDDATRAKQATDARLAVERTTFRVRARLDRSRRLLASAAGAGPGDPAADRRLARAEHAAASARRIVQIEAARTPAAGTPWSTAPDALVTESRLASASVLEAWATRAAAGARFDLALRLARRGMALDPTNEGLKTLVATLEGDVVTDAVRRSAPPPTQR